MKEIFINVGNPCIRSTFMAWTLAGHLTYLLPALRRVRGERAEKKEIVEILVRGMEI